jgi:hypothetical protein
LNNSPGENDGFKGMLVWNLDEKTRYALVTTAIGGSYLEDFVSYSLPYWLPYAQKHHLAIIALTDRQVFDQRDASMNGAWLKLLTPAVVLRSFPRIERIALVDTDVIINPSAPNVFCACPQDEIGVVSLEKNLPFDLLFARKRLAYLRNRFYSASYPLDSSLFATAEQEYSMEGLPTRDNLFCSGLVVIPQSKANLLSEWFSEAQSRDVEGAIAWEQTFLNHKVIEHGCHWLPYKFQSIWNLEMAISHPSLYQSGDLSGNNLAQRAVSDVLTNSFFLHFAGSWNESDAWKNRPSAVLSNMSGLESEDFAQYLAKIPAGLPVGKVSPSSN